MTKTIFLKKTFCSILLITFFWGSTKAQKQNHGYPINPVPFTSVTVTDNFWGQRLKASREVTVPLAFSKCEETGRYENFIKAANPSESYKVEGLAFDDTDVYKTIEGASYLLQTYPDAQLEHYIDSIIDIVEAAQEPDGYLYTSRTMNSKHPHEWAGSKRWEKVEDLSHEFYNLGHLIEGAIAYYQATGKRKLLNIAIGFADCVHREIGDGPGQTVAVPGHQIAEMALAKLYLVTGEQKYLDQAKFFLDKRGYTSRKGEYSQAHKPVIEQDEAVGHAVRATYMYSGMADVAALTGDKDYINAINAIWDNIVSKKYYVTGGIGATSNGEAFGKNYELPNMSAYCETCAAIANVYFNHRLFLLHGDAKYYDVLERTLYNGLISGVSLDGGAFFYPNPLESIGQHQRQPWFGCACCPSNVSRFIPSLPGYIYATKENNLYINLFMSNKSTVQVNNKTVEIEQNSDYPWEGNTKLTILKNKAGLVNLKIRIPGWIQNKVVPSNLYNYNDGKRLAYKVSLNGEMIDSSLENGYFTVSRKWKKGDIITIAFELQPRTVSAHPNIEADRGRIAVERGPLVYCAEWPDNPFDVLSVFMNKDPKFEVEKQPDLLEGIYTLRTKAQTLEYNTEGRLTVNDVDLRLIPYYAWAHRGPGAMSVWLPNELRASRPTQPATLSSESKVEASHKTQALSAINDRLVPNDKNDRSIPYYHWWPKKNSTEWITYRFPQTEEISSSTVYWFDDAPWGGCRVPKSWNLYYLDTNNKWITVPNPDKFTTFKGLPNIVTFTPIKTKAVKLEVILPEDNAAGIFEWEIK